MREIIIVAILCLVAALIADHFWLHGQLFAYRAR